jgi:hypothetical protein
MRSSNSQLCPTQAAGRCIEPWSWEPAMRSRGVRARALRRLFLFALVAGTVATPGASARIGAPRDAAPAVAADKGRVAEWKLFTAPDKAFSVRLPGEPTTSAKLGGTTYLVRIGRYVTYVVFASSVGVFPIDTSRPVPPISEILEKARDDSIEPLRELGGHVIWSKSSRVSGDSCITFLVELTPQGFPRQRALSRIILAVGAPRFLTIGYSAPTDEFQEPKANDFLDSLTLLEGSR